MIGTSGPSISTSDVIDTKPAKSRKNVFGGRAKNARFIAKDRCKLGGGHGAVISADFALAASRIGAVKEKTMPSTGISRIESEVNRQTGVNSDTTDTGNLFTQRGLLRGSHTLVSVFFVRLNAARDLAAQSPE